MILGVCWLTLRKIQNNAKIEISKTINLSSESFESQEEIKDLPKKELVLERNASGRVEYISAGFEKIDARVKGEAGHLLESMSDVIDVPFTQLIEQPLNLTTKTDLSRIVEFKQSIDGIEVYHGQITIHSRETDGAVFLINNGTKKVGSFERNPKLSYEDGSEILIEKYGESNIVSINLTRGPVVFVEDSGDTELAWIFEVKLVTPKLHGLESVVGAESGRVLSEIPTTVR